MNFDLKPKSTTASVRLDPDSNGLLTESAQRSGRAKKIEAEMRLKDHLIRFELITAVGVTKPRQKLEPFECE
jgi:hypothetical protein